MTRSTASALERLPAIVFQYSSNRLELLNKDVEVYPGLTAARIAKVLRGEWLKLVPEEFHSVVRKLGLLSESYVTVEFPVYWMGNTVWLRVFAAGVPQARRKKKIIGLAQDVTLQRQASAEMEPHAEHHTEEAEEHWRRLKHDINGSLTSIVMNCELLLDGHCGASQRQRIGAILAEALRIDRVLQPDHR